MALVIRPDLRLCYWRAARRIYVCDLCDEPMDRGERHLENLTDAPAFEGGPRMHVACAQRAGWVIDDETEAKRA